MPTRRLLYLSAHQMTAYRWQAGALVGEGLFEATESGQQQFAAYLRHHPDSLFALLANVAEEGFQVESIPFLRGDDRKAVIARKTGQLFFSATLTAARSLGYEKSRRKDERILLAALTNGAFFAPWLAALSESGGALSGIYSLPLLGGVLLKKLRIAEERSLLLTVQDQSIRQSYFEKGELLFSRLAPLHNSSIGGIAQSFASEALKLQQYLASQRMIGRSQPLTAHVLAHPNALKAIAASCIDTETLRFDILDIGDCARRTGLHTLPLDSHCEALFLHLLGAAPPATQFANDAQRHGYRLWQVRSALYGAGALALFGCLLFAGKLLVDTWNTEREASALLAEAASARARYEDIARTFPPIPTDHETLRRVINRYSELLATSPSPEGLYRLIGQALDDAPALAIDAIDWQIGPPAPADGASPGGESETALIRGTLSLGADHNPRHLLGAFRVFVDALQADPRLQVDVLQQPFDVESGKALKSGDSLGGGEQPRPFAVQVRRKAAA